MEFPLFYRLSDEDGRMAQRGYLREHGTSCDSESGSASGISENGIGMVQKAIGDRGLSGLIPGIGARGYRTYAGDSECTIAEDHFFL